MFSVLTLYLIALRTIGAARGRAARGSPRILD